MDTINIIPYHRGHVHIAIAGFEETMHHSRLHYSMRHLVSLGITSKETFSETLERAMQVCNYAGINIAHHFLQIYVFDAETGTIDADWLMSRRGFKLIVMQYPHMNEQLAQWLWELSDL
jgi:hypothetical protein